MVIVTASGTVQERGYLAKPLSKSSPRIKFDYDCGNSCNWGKNTAAEANFSNSSYCSGVEMSTNIIRFGGCETKIKEV